MIAPLPLLSKHPPLRRSAVAPAGVVEPPEAEPPVVFGLTFADVYYYLNIGNCFRGAVGTAEPQEQACLPARPDVLVPAAPAAACCSSAPVNPPSAAGYWSLLLVSVLTGNDLVSRIVHFENYTTGKSAGQG